MSFSFSFFIHITHLSRSRINVYGLSSYFLRKYPWDLLWFQDDDDGRAWYPPSICIHRTYCLEGDRVHSRLIASSSGWVHPSPHPRRHCHPEHLTWSVRSNSICPSSSGIRVKSVLKVVWSINPFSFTASPCSHSGHNIRAASRVPRGRAKPSHWRQTCIHLFSLHPLRHFMRLRSK